MSKLNQYDAWPELSYDKFKSTGYLLHMGSQAIGKLKLTTPFEPHWANVALWITGHGFTTGPIAYQQGIFSVSVDLINHQFIFETSWGGNDKFAIKTMSVAELTEKIFKTLKQLDVIVDINPLPQELTNPIAFNQDTESRIYKPELANAWFRALVSSYRVMQRYHAKFTGRSPSVGLMWGTFDLRDARYTSKQVPTIGDNAGYIRRNAMDVAQVEVGWWSGNKQYPRAAYFSFIYPQAEGLEKFKPQPNYARWEKSLGEFILDYDDLRKSKDPDNDLFAFFESTYQAEAEKSGWDPKLIGKGVPV